MHDPHPNLSTPRIERFERRFPAAPHALLGHRWVFGYSGPDLFGDEYPRHAVVSGYEKGCVYVRDLNGSDEVAVEARDLDALILSLTEARDAIARRTITPYIDRTAEATA